MDEFLKYLIIGFLTVLVFGLIKKYKKKEN